MRCHPEPRRRRGSRYTRSEELRLRLRGPSARCASLGMTDLWRGAPRVIARTDGQDARMRLNDAEPGCAEQRWKIESHIRFATSGSPARHDFVDETFHGRTARRETPRPVVDVFVKDRDPARTEAHWGNDVTRVSAATKQMMLPNGTMSHRNRVLRLIPP